MSNKIPLPKGSGDVNADLCTVDNVHFLAGAARLVSSMLNGPYVACVTRYGNEERAEKIIVTIADMNRHLVVDHKTWLISDYSDELSRSIEVAMDVLTDDMIDYCERCKVGKVFIIDKPFPVKELERKCQLCEAEMVRVPWRNH